MARISRVAGAVTSRLPRISSHEVTGSTSGSIWGSQVYTTDSHLGTAAVHSGVLRAGQRGIVRVWILPGQGSYAPSRSHGVKSYGYGPWSLSFSVERQ